MALAFFPLPAKADSACWLQPELKAYDITMQTLLLAHVAAACDGAYPSAASMRGDLGGFLARDQAQLNMERDYLAGFYHRAYGEDWQSPFKKFLDREDQRVQAQVTQNLSSDFCAGATKALQGITAGSWDDFTAEAESADWHGKTGFPACP